LKKNFHPALKLNLPKKLVVKKFSPEILKNKWDLIVIAVSSAGIDLIKKNLKQLKKKCPLSFRGHKILVFIFQTT